jgi:hypothetical protein
MTVLVLFAGAAGAGIVAADFGAGADHGFGDYVAVFVIPDPVFLFEAGLFVVKIFETVPLVGGFKFYHPFVVRQTAGA